MDHGNTLELVLARLPDLRSKIACSCVSKAWQSEIYRSLRKRIVFSGSNVPLSALCLLCSRLREARVTVASRDVVCCDRRLVDIVISGIRTNDLDFTDFKVSWKQISQIHDMLKVIGGILVDRGSLEALTWASGAHRVRVRGAHLMSFMQHIPAGADELVVRNCRVAGTPKDLFRRWVRGFRGHSLSFEYSRMGDAYAMDAIRELHAGVDTFRMERVGCGILTARLLSRCLDGMRDVDISQNYIRDNGAMMLVRGAAKLRHLDISGCSVSEEGGARIVAAVAKRPNLISVWVGDNKGAALMLASGDDRFMSESHE